jgi:DNA-binding transcriptional ArsR family regulator
MNLVFQALADPTRRAILSRLSNGICTVSELAEPFSISLAAVSKHVKVLERAHLLEQTREGRNHHCRLNPDPLKEAKAIIAELETFWSAQLDNLEDYLQQTLDPMPRSSEVRREGLSRKPKGSS